MENNFVIYDKVKDVYTLNFYVISNYLYLDNKYITFNISKTEFF